MNVYYLCFVSACLLSIIPDSSSLFTIWCTRWREEYLSQRSAPGEWVEISELRGELCRWSNSPIRSFPFCVSFVIYLWPNFTYKLFLLFPRHLIFSSQYCWLKLTLTNKVYIFTYLFNDTYSWRIRAHFKLRKWRFLALKAKQFLIQLDSWLICFRRMTDWQKEALAFSAWEVVGCKKNSGVSIFCGHHSPERYLSPLPLANTVDLVGNHYLISRGVPYFLTHFEMFVFSLFFLLWRNWSQMNKIQCFSRLLLPIS